MVMMEFYYTGAKMLAWLESFGTRRAFQSGGILKISILQAAMVHTGKRRTMKKGEDIHFRQDLTIKIGVKSF